MTGLRIAQALGAKTALLRSNSQVVIEQVKGDFEAKELTNQLVSRFDRVEFAQIPQDQNVEVDEVARSASLDDQVKVNNWRLEE